jgi:acyl-coenzyme A thioesterase PaaI-like protein
MSDSRTFGLADYIHFGEDPVEPSVSHAKRRRLARSLQNISSSMFRMDANAAEIDGYLRQVEALEAQFSKLPKVDSSAIFKKIVRGDASGEELLMDRDHIVLTGRANPISLPMDFSIRDDRVVGTVTVPFEYQGPPQRAHGGVVAAIFDVLLHKTQKICGFMGFTASLTVDYVDSTPLDTELELEAWIEKVDGRKLYNAGKITRQGKECAKAKGLWIQPNSGTFG